MHAFVLVIRLSNYLMLRLTGHFSSIKQGCKIKKFNVLFYDCYVVIYIDSMKLHATSPVHMHDLSVLNIGLY